MVARQRDYKRAAPQKVKAMTEDAFNEYFPDPSTVTDEEGVALCASLAGIWPIIGGWAEYLWQQYKAWFGLPSPKDSFSKWFQGWLRSMLWPAFSWLVD